MPTSKDLLGWVVKNRDWLFSGAGIALLSVFVYFLRLALQALSGRRPPDLRVEVKPAIVHHPAIGSIDFLTITVQNFSSFPAFVDSFLIELPHTRTFFEERDGLTQRLQGKCEVRPGDSLTFNIPGADLRQFMAREGLVPEDFGRAYVKDAVGRCYYASRKETRGAIRSATAERTK